MLKSTEQPLATAYDVALLDLDGVVYIGPEAVPGAAGHLTSARAAGMHLAYVTNNASRPPHEVAEHLRDLGIPAEDADVVTSAQAAARVLAEKLSPGARVFVIGGPGLFEALSEEGLEGVQSTEAEPAAVVSGYSADLTWRTVAEGAILVGEGLFWVASNLDYSVPTPLGRGPGNGVLVEAVGRFAGRDPVVAGKPRPPLFEETIRRVGGDRPLVVGDRLDTDIEGANNTGFDSLLVLTGVTGLAELVGAAAGSRPTFIAEDLAGLGVAHQHPVRVNGSPSSFELGGWRGDVRDGSLRVVGDGPAGDWWRVVAATGWAHLDATGQSVETDAVRAPG